MTDPAASGNVRANAFCEHCYERWIGVDVSSREAFNDLERQRVLHICTPPPGAPSGIWSIAGIPTNPLSQTSPVPELPSSRTECEDGIIMHLDAMNDADRSRRYVSLYDGGWRLDRAEEITRTAKHAIDDMLTEALSYVMLHRRYGLTITTARHACEAGS